MSAVPQQIKPHAPRAGLGVVTWRYVTVDEASRCTGYTIAAINQKIDKGIWRQGHEWVQAPDGRRLIDRDGYEAWVRLGRPGDSE